MCIDVLRNIYILYMDSTVLVTEYYSVSLPAPDDLYGPVIRHVNKTIRSLQRSSYVHLSEALHGPLKAADLGAPGGALVSQGAPQGEAEGADTDNAEDANEETAEQWEELWAEGFSALSDHEGEG